MAVSESLDLKDIRKTQSRLRCLLRIQDVKEVQPIRIRRKPLPPGFCYVCSRLDPNARHRTPNGYLFGKGFFAHCEHQPRPPYPTFIEDDNDDDIFNDQTVHHVNNIPNIPEQHINPDWNLSVSVTIKNKNKNSPSPDQKYSKKYFNTAVLNGVEDEENEHNDKYRLPPVFHSDQFESGKFILNASDRTFAEAGHLEDESQYDPVSDEENKLPPLLDGRNIVSRSDISEDKPDQTARSSIRPIKKRQSVKKKRRVRKEEAEPQHIEEPVPTMMDNITRQEEDDEDEDEGILKYSHRDEFTSLPNEGLEMAPSRDTSKLTSGPPEMTSEGRRKSLNSNHEVVVKEIPPSMTIQKIGSAELWCECSDVDLSTLKCHECKLVGGHEKWCTYARSASRHGKCPNCGKHIRKTNEVKVEVKRKQGMSLIRKLSKTTTKSEDSDLSRKRPLSDTPFTAGKTAGLHVRFEDDKDSTHAERHVNQPRSKTVTDDDYISDNDYMYNREGWVDSPDFENDFDQYPVQTYPRVDPNIHRDAYYKAIAARSLEKLKKLDEVDEKFAADRISKPHVFSYFKLRPHQKNALPGGPDNIGILPSESAHVQPRKAMKHIFGKIKVDDFYPGGKRNKAQVSVSYSKERKKQTMPINKWTRGGLNG